MSEEKTKLFLPVEVKVHVFIDYFVILEMNEKIRKLGSKICEK